MSNSQQYTGEAISVIRDKALLLTMANEYLCEEVFLKKMGKDIEQSISRIKDDISSLKKEFPGKFAIEVNTDDILNDLNNTAQSLLNPGKDVKDACFSGKLGSELESSVKSIADAVNKIRMQVKGGKVTYTKKDSMVNMVDRFKGIGSSLESTLGIAAKIVACIIVICVLAFSYLYFTMEKESTLLKNIATSQDIIKEKQDTLAGLESKMEEVSKDIKEIENDDMVSGKRIALMELEVEIQKINQDHHDIEAEIVVQEDKIEDYEKRIEELKKVPFIKRLLRQ